MIDPRDGDGSPGADSLEPIVPVDETIVTPRVVQVDETVVTPRAAPIDETIVTPRAVPADETVVTPRAVPADETIVTPAPEPATPLVPNAPSGMSRNPAPPIAEPAPLELPPEIAARMFKSPLDAKYRVPEAPTPAPEHALPRRGVTPALPVLTSTRSGRRAAESPDTDSRFGAPPESRPAAPGADRSNLRSTERANRRFGRGAIAGFAASIVVAVAGLWLVATLAFG